MATLTRFQSDRAEGRVSRTRRLVGVVQHRPLTDRQNEKTRFLFLAGVALENFQHVIFFNEATKFRVEIYLEQLLFVRR